MELDDHGPRYFYLNNYNERRLWFQMNMERDKIHTSKSYNGRYENKYIHAWLINDSTIKVYVATKDVNVLGEYLTSGPEYDIVKMFLNNNVEYAGMTFQEFLDKLSNVSDGQ